MEDQRRVVIAVALCLAIVFVWQWLMADQVRPVQKPRATVEKSVPVPSGDVPSVSGQPSVSAGTATVAIEQRPFSTPLLYGELTNAPALTKLRLSHYKEEPAKDAPTEPVSLVTAQLEGARRQALVELQVGGKVATFTFGDDLVLQGGAEGIQSELKVKPRREAYAIDYELSVKNAGALAVPISLAMHLGLAPGEGASEGSFMTPPADMVHGFCAEGTDVVRQAASDVQEAPYVQQGIEWAGLDRQYFVVAALPEKGPPHTCRITAQGETVLVDVGMAQDNVAAGATWTTRFTVYFGPKRTAELDAVDPLLKNVIDYSTFGIPMGFLARPMVFILNLFHDWSQNWGVAIILLTLFVKTLLFPFTYKSVVSMRRMQLVKPELDKLKKQYEGDRERLQMEQLKLFREKGVNPLGGCLPMLLQTPVWLALYRTLQTAVDLYEQPFLWIDNLTAKEHFPFLAIAFGLLTIVQQRLNPPALDSQQQKIMMYGMPVFFAFLMISLPSGLVLYIVVNSILTILQQLVINRRQVAL